MSSPFRHRIIGRAASPPTWACYEQIPYNSSSSSSSSEDDLDSPSSEDEEALEPSSVDGEQLDKDQLENEDVKGKGKAVEKQPKPVKRRHVHQPYTLRSILTIQRSQGFVWNQDLFVPPYIKDRYVASTSPPGRGFTAPNEYEVEVVEIRVREGELGELIP